MALLPSISLILGALLLIPLRGRRPQLVTLISSGFAVAVAIGLFLQVPIVNVLSLWRPIELFGPGFIFSIDETTWSFLLLGSVVVFAEALLDGKSVLRLLYSGIALAAIAAGDLLAIAMLWTLMISIETAHRLTNSDEIEASLRKAAIQFVAVAALMAAAFYGEGAAVFLALAALFRSIGGTKTHFPFSLSIMAPLGALAAASRYPSQSSMLLWIGSAVVAVALFRSLFYKSRITIFALALTGAGYLAMPDAQGVTWVTVAAVLIASIGLEFAGGSRLAWFAVAAIPFAFLLAPLDPELLVLATLGTASLAAISRLRSRASRNLPPTQVELGSVAVLIAASASAMLISGWLPNLMAVIVAGIGLAAGYAITRAHPALSKVQLPETNAMDRVGRAVARYLAAAVRTTAEVLEGESAVLWILLVLLIVVVGLQAVTS